jgi:hypothetical protein
MEDVFIVHRTAKALLIEHSDELFWVPLSQVENAEFYRPGNAYAVLRVAEWFAFKTAMI